jgi:FKBP-type peptidyl-prolyl cis-trans isomerase FkpA
MKKYLVIGSVLLTVSAAAQKTATKKPVTSKAPVAASNALKNRTDSVSYAIGMSIANFYSREGLKNFNTAQVARGINDIMSKKKPAFTDEQAQMTIILALNTKLADNMKKGEQFLAANKSKPGIKTTASGLQYQVITEGKGQRPLATDTVEVNYKGTLIDGTEFDNSYKRGSSISFPLNGVIKGWTEALQLMTVGSKYRLFIPQQLAYGPNDNQAIPGGSVLIFEVELLNIKKPQ